MIWQGHNSSINNNNNKHNNNNNKNNNNNNNNINNNHGGSGCGNLHNWAIYIILSHFNKKCRYQAV